MSLGEPTIYALEPTGFMDFVARSLGANVAASIRQRFGGSRIYIPTYPEDHHALCKAIGVAEVQHITLMFGFGYVDIPLGEVSRGRQIEQACIAGRTVTDVARSFGCCTRTVSKARARLRRQGLMP